jgi:hypothetical protein
LSNKYKNEVHGDHKKPGGLYNYSFDGTNCVDSDVETYKAKYSDSVVFFFWHPRFNLKWSMKDPTPRPQRNALPSRELIRSVTFLASQKGSTSMQKNWLLKSHAERHDAQDQKGDKLLIIAPHRGSEIVLKNATNGQVVDRLKYYGPFSAGGYRYYSNNFGYQVATKARGLTQIWLNKKNYGTCNPGFRDPTFR